MYLFHLSDKMNEQYPYSYKIKLKYIYDDEK